MTTHPRLFPAFAFLSLAALVAPGCNPDGGSKACTDLAAASVGVTIEAADGGAVDGATVSWSQDGGASTACDDITGDWICGYEVIGNVDVTVSLPGYADQTQTATVASDGCHAIEEHLDFVMQPVNM